MTPRRLLLLAAVLLLVQLAGLLHGLTHLRDHDHGGGPHAACEWCVAYAALDHALNGVPPAPPALATPTDLYQALPQSQAFRATLPYRSRAPPAHLA